MEHFYMWQSRVGVHESMVCILALPLTGSVLQCLEHDNMVKLRSRIRFLPRSRDCHLYTCTFTCCVHVVYNCIHVHIIIHFPEKAQISNVILAGEYN